MTRKELEKSLQKEIGWIPCGFILENLYEPDEEVDKSMMKLIVQTASRKSEEITIITGTKGAELFKEMDTYLKVKHEEHVEEMKEKQKEYKEMVRKNMPGVKVSRSGGIHFQKEEDDTPKYSDIEGIEVKRPHHDRVGSQVEWTIECQKCGSRYTVKSVFPPDPGMCTAPMDARTSGICGGQQVIVHD